MKSSPPPVVPDTLSGPGLRDDGSQVKRYGRAGGPSGVDERSGLVGLEGRDETSDISCS